MNDVIILKNAGIYQKKHLIINEINFSLGAGEFCYLIGKTGAGKSSLIKTLYGELPLSKGIGEVVGFDLRSLTRKSIPTLRRKLGIVFQDFNLFMDRSVYQNLSFVLKATDWKDKFAIEERIAEVLTDVGILHKINEMPHRLSGGEQQRLVIARALLNKPSLILADEATGNLDPYSSHEIMTLIRNLVVKNHTAILFATHDHRIIQKFPSRVFEISEGHLAEKIESN